MIQICGTVSRERLDCPWQQHLTRVLGVERVRYHSHSSQTLPVYQAHPRVFNCQVSSCHLKGPQMPPLKGHATWKCYVVQMGHCSSWNQSSTIGLVRAKFLWLLTVRAKTTLEIRYARGFPKSHNFLEICVDIRDFAREGMVGRQIRADSE